MVKPMEEIVVANTNTCTPKAAATAATTSVERKPRPQTEQALNCPRCNSTNTKFCYYNNYSLTQPRYFCKSCRRYWTEGGSLRNIPVGGGTRKNRRPSTSMMSDSIRRDKMLKLPDLITPPQIPNIQGQDLNLGIPGSGEFRTISEFLQVPNIIKGQTESNKGEVGCSSTHQQTSALELLHGFTSRGLMSSFLPRVPGDQTAFYSSGYPPMQEEFKQNVHFALDQGPHGSSKDPFPFEDLKQMSSPRKGEENREAAAAAAAGGGGRDSSHGYWTGMISGGSW